MTPHAKFHANLPKGASWKIGEIYTKIFVAIYFFYQLTYTSDLPLADFCAMAQTMRYQARVCLFGVRKLKFNLFITKIRKNYNSAYGEIKQSYKWS